MKAYLPLNPFLGFPTSYSEPFLSIFHYYHQLKKMYEVNRYQVEDDSLYVYESIWQFLKRSVRRKILTWNRLSLIQKYKLKRTSWYENIAKGTTDPRVEFILPNFQSNFLRSYHKFKHKSLSHLQNLSKASTENFNPTSSPLNLKFKILTNLSSESRPRFNLDSTFYKISAEKNDQTPPSNLA